MSCVAFLSYGKDSLKMLDVIKTRGLPLDRIITFDGCWFCHNQRAEPLRHLRKHHPLLWELLLKWDKDSPYSFRADGHTVHDFEERFRLEDCGLLDPNKYFCWDMLNRPLQYRLF